MAKTAADFEKIIHADRSRKKNEALAAKIFGKDRRASVPIKAGAPAPAGGKIAARAGVKKRVASTSAAPRPGNIDSEWTHDLHDAGADARKSSGPGTLASRISRPGDAARTKKSGAAVAAAAATGSAVGPHPVATRARQQRRAAQVANALNRAELQQDRQRQQQGQQQSQQQQLPATLAATSSGLSIRGIAAAVDPPVVMAQNFAPGTTAADIESAVTPVGGLVSSCRILKTTPIVIAELVFESRDGAERVIETFNNQTADGRVLHVYAKAVTSNGGGGGGGVLTPHTNNTLAGARPVARGKSGGSGGATTTSHVVDGSLGFDDPMDTDGFGQRGGSGGQANGANGAAGGRFYSDDLVGSRPAPGQAGGRRGRGWGGRR